MGVTFAAAADAIGSYFTADAAFAAGTDIAAEGALTASDLALTAGAEGATAATAGATAADVAVMQGVGGTAAGLTGAAEAASTGLTTAQMISGAQAGLGVANLATTLLTPRPSIGTPTAPSALPQAAQSPNASAVSAGLAGTGQAGGSGGVAQTLLTGAAGVDPNSLNLGKNTLLGG